MKARIIERIAPNGEKVYIIQQRHWLFSWWWKDVSLNSGISFLKQDYFPTLEEAKKNLCFFDGTPWKNNIINIEKGE